MDIQTWKQAAKEVMQAAEGPFWDQILAILWRASQNGETPELDEFVYEQLQFEE
jgi:hypothetical protein